MTNKQHSVSSFFEQLFGIEAIDKFIAKEFGFVSELSEDDALVWAGLLVYLSYMQRNGHSCIYLKDIAGTVLFNEPTAVQGGDNQNGEVIEVEASDAVALRMQNELSSSAQLLQRGQDENQNSSPKKGFNVPELTPLIKIVKSALENEQNAQLFVYENGKLYSRRYYEFEQEVAKSVVDRTALTRLDEQASENVKALWPAIFPTETTNEQDWQQIAVAKSLMQRFCVINGGPGTGKTYTVLRLLLALQACDEALNIVLAAPTGKAQQRMTESIMGSIEGLRGKVDDDALNRVPTDAVTLHRLLGLREHGVSTKFHQHNTLNADVLIVDEASMVDLALMTRIVRALPSHARLYFIGDADQLPAVELGNVLEQLVDDEPSLPTSQELANGVIKTAPDLNNNLSDALSLGAVPSELRQYIATLCPHLPLLSVNEQAKSYVATLQAPQRFKGQVAEVATAIQRGDAAGALKAISANTNSAGEASEPSKSNTQRSAYLQSGVHLFPESQVTTRELQQLAKESFLPIFDATSAKEALERLNYVRWLTPVRKGVMGVEGLNNLVFDAIKHKIRRREGQFYQGQPIMIVKNHHPQRLSNGEVGVIWPDQHGKLYAWFFEEQKNARKNIQHENQHANQNIGLRCISLSRVPQFETVYAMTIHKSQGSEFKHVVLILPQPESDNAANLFHRGLVYTGLTRAKDGCLIIANNGTFSGMVSKVDKRYSGLSEAINRYKTDTSTTE
ncbi:exodeoxyribonuclease V subunit alpha [Alteromonas gracilis]|uniref:exodeoxyribonuclease V subunit alpha n=1 Tax=Alteromonas gracilis TaxID=1479524 RepID=UPI0037367178